MPYWRQPPQTAQPRRTLPSTISDPLPLWERAGQGWPRRGGAYIPLIPSAPPGQAWPSPTRGDGILETTSSDRLGRTHGHRRRLSTQAGLDRKSPRTRRLSARPGGAGHALRQGPAESVPPCPDHPDRRQPRPAAPRRSGRPHPRRAEGHRAPLRLRNQRPTHRGHGKGALSGRARRGRSRR